MIIKDEILEPFFISVEDNQFVLKETRTPDPNNPLTKDVTKEYETIHGYFVDFGVLLKRLIQIKVSREDKVATLKEFFTLWQYYEDQFISILPQPLKDGRDKSKVVSEEV